MLNRTSRSAAQWSADLKQLGVAVSPADPRSLRFVTHRHIDDAAADQALSAFNSLWHRAQHA